jgi:hypothetical protein
MYCTNSLRQDLRKLVIARPLLAARVHFIAVSTLVLTATAQAQQLTVRVQDAAGVALPFAKVFVESSPRGVTDSTGSLRTALPKHSWLTLRVARIPYTAVDLTITKPSVDTVVSVTLQLATAQLGAVVTTATRVHAPLARSGFYDRLDRSVRGGVSGQFITPEELSLRNPSMISDVLRALRGINVVGSGSNAIVQGRGGCLMEIVLDGQRLSNGAGGRSRGYGLVNDLVNGSEVVGIEIYNSAQSTPVDIAPIGSACGTIVIWTGGRR